MPSNLLSPRGEVGFLHRVLLPAAYVIECVTLNNPARRGSDNRYPLRECELFPPLHKFSETCSLNIHLIAVQQIWL